MRVLPIQASRRSVMRRGTSYSLGKEVFAVDRRDPLTKETLDRLVPSALAKEFVRSYLAQQGEPEKAE
jgi:hypothetical protein